MLTAEFARLSKSQFSESSEASTVETVLCAGAFSGVSSGVISILSARSATLDEADIHA